MIRSKVAQSAATPTETPEEKAAREAEQARAEAAQIDETQGLLTLDTLRRQRRFGRLGLRNPFGSPAGGGSGSASLAPANFGSPGMTNAGAPSAFSGYGLGKLVAE